MPKGPYDRTIRRQLDRREIAIGSCGTIGTVVYLPPKEDASIVSDGQVVSVFVVVIGKPKRRDSLVAERCV